MKCKASVMKVLDIKLIRENPGLVRKNFERRGSPEYLEMLDVLLECDKVWRQKLTELNELRRERNRITAEIATAKKKGRDVSAIVSKAKIIDGKITELEEQVSKHEEKIRQYLMKLPNLLHESVPIGKDELDNVTVRTWGKIPDFSFPVKDHIDLGLSLDIMDIERAGKIAGARFFYLKGEGVLLDMALLNFALEEMVKRAIPL